MRWGPAAHMGEAWPGGVEHGVTHTRRAQSRPDGHALHSRALPARKTLISLFSAKNPGRNGGGKMPRKEKGAQMRRGCAQAARSAGWAGTWPTPDGRKGQKTCGVAAVLPATAAQTGGLPRQAHPPGQGAAEDGAVGRPADGPGHPRLGGSPQMRGRCCCCSGSAQPTRHEVTLSMQLSSSQSVASAEGRPGRGRVERGSEGHSCELLAALLSRHLYVRRCHGAGRLCQVTPDRQRGLNKEQHSSRAHHAARTP